MSRITTVRGDIKPEELGVTTMHEHTIFRTMMLIKALLRNGTYKPEQPKNPETSEESRNSNAGKAPKGVLRGVIKMLSNPALRINSEKYYIQELVEFKKTGGQSLVDATPIAGHVNMNKIRRLSENSGVNIVACTGFYVEPAIPKKLVTGGEAAMMEALSKEIEHGIGRSGVKPGFVKCALSKIRDGKISEIEMMSMRACAKTTKKYGMSLHIHTAYPLIREMILDAADVLINKTGIKPERVLVCHIDAISIRFLNPNLEVNGKGYNSSLALELLRRGFNVDFDSWGGSIQGKEIGLAQDESRFQLLKELVESGFAGRICLGHDMTNKIFGTQAGAYGYTRFPTFVPQRMKEEGMDLAAYHQMTVENPARILTY
jgi:phosphotriesterase-related protein